jgi:DNA ligase-1
MKPMLSATCASTEGLDYPLLASPKLDGIRALVIKEQLVSRNLKQIRNAHTYAKFSKYELEGLDGELILGPHDATVFRRTTSAVSRAMGTEDVQFWVFDVHMPNTPFASRQEYLTARTWPAGVKVVPQVWVHNANELNLFEEKCLHEGYEGVMLRHPHGPYKQGRSTLNEGYLMKLKRFDDAEAIIIGKEERMHNGNAATTDALGHTKRTSHQANLVGRGDLGAIVVRGINGPYEGVEFTIGTGFDDADRASLWGVDLTGRTVKYKYFPMGSKDRPRFPVFLGFRELGT